MRELRRCALRVEWVQAQLRGEDLSNLAEVERLFFEPAGSFGIVRRAQEQAGLSLVAEWD